MDSIENSLDKMYNPSFLKNVYGLDPIKNSIPAETSIDIDWMLLLEEEEE
jgi:hypothetical protein